MKCLKKINSKLEFPKELNLNPYCIEDITRKEMAKKASDTGVEFDPNSIETEEIYFKDDAYYNYNLVGVTVHTGSADSGHYYSFINSVRTGEPNDRNEAIYDPKNEKHTMGWLEFNDSHVSKFEFSKLEEECFGGKDEGGSSAGIWNFGGEKAKSAYLLVYERKIKNPIKVIVVPPTDTSNVISFKEEEANIIKKQYDISMRYTDKDDYNSFKQQLYHKIFFDAKWEEYFKYVPFFSIERLIPKKHYVEIKEDNTQFLMQQNISDDQFVMFFDSVIGVLDETLSHIKDINVGTLGKIAATLLNFIFNILSQKDKQKVR